MKRKIQNIFRQRGPARMFPRATMWLSTALGLLQFARTKIIALRHTKRWRVSRPSRDRDVETESTSLTNGLRVSLYTAQTADERRTVPSPHHKPWRSAAGVQRPQHRHRTVFLRRCGQGLLWSISIPGERKLRPMKN